MVVSKLWWTACTVHGDVRSAIVINKCYVPVKSGLQGIKPGWIFVSVIFILSSRFLKLYCFMLGVLACIRPKENMNIFIHINWYGWGKGSSWKRFADLLWIRLFKNHVIAKISKNYMKLRVCLSPTKSSLINLLVVKNTVFKWDLGMLVIFSQMCSNKNITFIFHV